MTDAEPHVHRWIGLSPSSSLGVAYRCYGCGESKFEETPRCRCPEGNHGTHWSQGRVWPNRRITDGVCSACDLIVPGYEDDVMW